MMEVHFNKSHHGIVFSLKSPLKSNTKSIQALIVMLSQVSIQVLILSKKAQSSALLVLDC